MECQYGFQNLTKWKEVMNNKAITLTLIATLTASTTHTMHYSNVVGREAQKRIIQSIQKQKISQKAHPELTNRTIRGAGIISGVNSAVLAAVEKKEAVWKANEKSVLGWGLSSMLGFSAVAFPRPFLVASSMGLWCGTISYRLTQPNIRR